MLPGLDNKKLTTKTNYHSPQDFVHFPDGLLRNSPFPSYAFAGYILGLRQCKMIKVACLEVVRWLFRLCMVHREVTSDFM